MRFTRTLPVLLVVGLLAAADWPHQRGPHHDGRLPGAGLPPGPLALNPVWEIALGSGYSGVALSAGKAVTFYSDGEVDLAVALDAATGRELWRYTIGETYRGHDGSHDGPLSTPLVDGDAVYGLGPHGKLFALRLRDGAEIWSSSLKDDWKAPEPDYGFSTTPLVHGDLLLVQVGAPDGRSLAGLDKATGRKRWSLGDGKVEYQSPVLRTLAGRLQVVAVAGKKVLAADPDDGTLLWEAELGEKATTYSAHVVPVDDHRVFIRAGGDSIMYRVEAHDGTLSAKESYRTAEFGNSYSAPVFHDGHLYGYKGQFLTCVDAATGKRVWKSRPPGGHGLILLDDRLVIFGAEGHLVVAEASPEGYREIARRQVLARSAYTWPSFTDGRVYLRNLDAVTSVSVESAAKTAAAEVPLRETAPRTEFESWVRRVQSSSEPAAEVRRFLDDNPRFPLVEDGFVHFLYVGKAEDVGLEASMLPAGRTETMQRLAGTDLFFRTYELGTDGRIDYRYQIDFEERVADPRNPRKVPAPWDDTGFSEVSLSGQPVPAFLSEPSGPRGRLEAVALSSKILDKEREITLYLPAGYDDGEARYPLLFVAEGDQWMEKGLMVNALDNLIAGGSQPVVVVFVGRSPTFWREGGGQDSGLYARMLAEELVPVVEAKVRAVGTADGRALLGIEGHAAAMAYTLLHHPDVFGKAALLSVNLDGMTEEPILAAAAARRSDPVVYLTWNRYENLDPVQDWDPRGDSRELAAALRRGGYAVQGGERADSYGWGGWRTQTAGILTALFPAE